MWARIGVVLAAVLTSLVLTGAGQVKQADGGPENAAAAHAVAVLTGIEDGPAEEAVPADFAEVRGYQPQIVTEPDGEVRVLRPDGDCSTAFGVTKYNFTNACLTHDYGYELLRYAQEQGGELGPWARVAIDDLLGVDLHRRCDIVDGGGGCEALASLGVGVVKANSWRQGQGTPTAEVSGPYVASAILVLAAIVVPPVAARIKRTRHEAAVTLAGEGSTA